MCDNTAVSWSDYERSRSQIEYEVRLKIAKELENYLEKHRYRGLPLEYDSGIRKAILIVLYENAEKFPEYSRDVQDKLF